MWSWARGLASGRGRWSKRVAMEGRRGSMTGVSGGRERGEKRVWERVWRRRVWVVRWEVRALWAVTRLEVGGELALGGGFGRVDGRA